MTTTSDRTLKWHLRSQGPVKEEVGESTPTKKGFKSPKFNKGSAASKNSKIRKEPVRRRKNAKTAGQLGEQIIEKNQDTQFQELQISFKNRNKQQTYGEFYFHELGMFKEEDVFEALLFIKQLPALSVQLHPPSLLQNGNSFALPTKRSPKQKTLVLDLDETLVHASMDEMESFDFTVSITFNNEQTIVYVKCRPYLKQFLESVAQKYEVVVFTASLEAYADKVLDVIDRDRRMIQHRLFRDSCLFISGNYLKNLAVLGRDPCSTIIVDNSVQAFGYQLENAIPILGFTNDETDTELIRMSNLLLRASTCKDIRKFIETEIGWSTILQQLSVE
eukprot:TRINITY_DN5685_c0_g1_i1.p1 TRINITY_DN5685_c0_g1~~TRINITY_DN5685_c0_g1_i1.p1  ORF type:complete len:384 (-),score=40.85 TRINITY_DN5685_c0_g1_i1:773-1771(-)